MVPAAAILLLGLALAAGAAADAPAGPRFGEDVAGRWGIGAMSSTAPAAFRHHFDHRLGMEVGLGYATRRDAGKALSALALEGALLFAMAPGDRVNVYLRPSAGFMSDERADGTYSTVSLGAGFQFEVFVTRDFSVAAYQGISIDFVGPPADAAPNRTRAALRGLSWPRMGFTYYLP